MKKSIFAVAMMCVALVFTACDGDKNKNAVTAIALNPAELKLNVDESSRLSVSVTPENATYNSDDLVWSSSDTTVAVVSYNGTVTALEKGTANITVKYNDLTAVCQVTVKDWFDDITFTGVYFGISDTSYYGNELDTIRSSANELYNVKKVQAYVALFSAGFYLNSDYEFAGGTKGAIVEAEAPMYWAPGWANGSDGGVIFCLGEWYIVDTLMSKCMPTGKVNDLYLSNMKLFLDNLNAGDQTTAFSVNMKAAGEDGCEGSLMTVYEYHSTAEGYSSDGYYSSYVPDLFFGRGYFYALDNYVASNVLCSVEGHHFTAKPLLETEADDNDNFYGYGCHWHFDENAGYSWVDENILFGDEYTYDYNLDVFEDAAPRRVMEIRNFGDIKTTKMLQKKLRSVPQDNNIRK